MVVIEGVGRRLDPTINIWALAQPLIEEWMRSHFGPRATLERAAADVMQALRRLPRLIDNLLVVLEGERQRAEQADEVASTEARRWRPGFSEVIAVLALIAAIVAWWH